MSQKEQTMNLTKAIIAVAGYGTRRMPITKTIEKCMLPIGNRPVVDYLVEDCIANGITDIIFVVGEQHEQIKNYYSGRNEQLEAYLHAKGKTKELGMLKELTHGANYRYVVQDRNQPYGTAVPVALCADLVDADEQVLFLAGDDFIYNPQGVSAITQLLGAVKKSGTNSALLGAEIAHEDVSKYGVIEMHDGAFVRIVEKPTIDDAPSNLINISKYVFDKNLVNHAVTVLKQPAANGECQITDALNLYVSEGKKALVIPAEGEYFDGGNPEGWLYANNKLLKTAQA
jgi:UTP--glucose-1-phosphate uridylyltransferase